MLSLQPSVREEEEAWMTSEEPVVLTVEEAARLLRIGRSAAYEQARRFIATGDAEGLPVVRLGRRLRVPRQALTRLLGVSTTDPGAPTSPALREPSPMAFASSEQNARMTSAPRRRNV